MQAEGPPQKQSLRATVRVSGGATYLRLEESGVELGGGSSVRVACRGRRFAAATMRLPGEIAVHGLALPRAVAEECGLAAGDAVTVDVQGGGDGDGRVPDDAAAALAAAGTDVSALAPKERRLAVTLVREAGSPRTRRERIEALVEACLEAGRRN